MADKKFDPKWEDMFAGEEDPETPGEEEFEDGYQEPYEEYEDIRQQEALFRQRKKRSRRRWYRFLLIYTLVILLAGAIGCFVFYQYLDSYEISRPEHVMDELMLRTSSDQWYKSALDGFQAEFTEFEDPKQLFSDYYEAVLKDARYTYRKDAGSSAPEAPAYVIRSGPVELCRVTLKSVGDAGFGLHLWEVGTIQSCFAMDSLQSMAVEIDAPADQKVFLNGVELGEEYIVDREIPCPDMTELEQRFTDKPFFVRYRVDEMYGRIAVTDSSDKTLSTVETGEDGVVRYLLPETDFYSFTVKAPSDVIVTVGGAELKPEDAAKSGPGVLKGMEEYVGEGGYETLTYQLDGLYSLPEITARDSEGHELQPVANGDNGEKLSFFHANDEQLQTEQKARVEQFFDSYMYYSQQAYSEANYYALLGCIQQGTELYEYIRDSVDAMYWASDTKVTYEELSFTDFASVNENCFTCTIRYKADFSAQAWYESYTYGLQNAYEMVFVKGADGVWYAAAMAIV